MRRALFAAIILTLTLSVVAFAEDRPQIQPVLSAVGSAEWATEIRVRVNKLDAEATRSMLTLSVGSDIGPRFPEMLVEEYRAMESEVFRYRFQFDWRPHLDAGTRHFTLRSQMANPFRSVFRPDIPTNIQGVLDARGNLVQLHVGTYPMNMVGLSLIVPFPERAIEVGDSWATTTTRKVLDMENLIGEMELIPIYHQYTLLGMEVRDGFTLAHLRQVSHSEYDGVISVEVFVGPIDYRVRQQVTLEADLWVDVSTGLVREAVQTVRMDNHMVYLPDEQRDVPENLPRERVELFLSFDQPTVVDDVSLTLQLNIQRVSP